MLERLTFLDANIFMYAAGAPHRYREACVQILQDLERGSLQAAIETEIMQERLYRYSHIGQAEKGIILCRQMLAYPLTLLSVTATDMRLAVDLFEGYQSAGISPRDAVHGAVMQSNGITRLISADAGFDCFGLLVRVDPLAYVSTS